MRFRRPTLRTKLAAAVLIGFVMMIAAGLHSLYMADAARDAAETARRNHRLVSAYTRLSYQTAHV